MSFSAFGPTLLISFIQKEITGGREGEEGGERKRERERKREGERGGEREIEREREREKGEGGEGEG